MLEQHQEVMDFIPSGSSTEKSDLRYTPSKSLMFDIRMPDTLKMKNINFRADSKVLKKKRQKNRLRLMKLEKQFWDPTNPILHLSKLKLPERKNKAATSTVVNHATMTKGTKISPSHQALPLEYTFDILCSTKTDAVSSGGNEFVAAPPVFVSEVSSVSNPNSDVMNAPFCGDLIVLETPVASNLKPCQAGQESGTHGNIGVGACISPRTNNSDFIELFSSSLNISYASRGSDSDNCLLPHNETTSPTDVQITELTPDRLDKTRNVSKTLPETLEGAQNEYFEEWQQPQIVNPNCLLPVQPLNNHFVELIHNVHIQSNSTMTSPAASCHIGLLNDQEHVMQILEPCTSSTDQFNTEVEHQTGKVGEAGRIQQTVDPKTDILSEGLTSQEQEQSNNNTVTLNTKEESMISASISKETLSASGEIKQDDLLTGIVTSDSFSDRTSDLEHSDHPTEFTCLDSLDGDNSLLANGSSSIDSCGSANTEKKLPFKSHQELVDQLNKDPFPKTVRKNVKVLVKRRAFSLDDALIASVIYESIPQGTINDEDTFKERDSGNCESNDLIQNLSGHIEKAETSFCEGVCEETLKPLDGYNRESICIKAASEEYLKESSIDPEIASPIQLQITSLSTSKFTSLCESPAPSQSKTPARNFEGSSDNLSTQHLDSIDLKVSAHGSLTREHGKSGFPEEMCGVRLFETISPVGSDCKNKASSVDFVQLCSQDMTVPEDSNPLTSSKVNVSGNEESCMTLIECTINSNTASPKMSISVGDSTKLQHDGCSVICSSPKNSAGENIDDVGGSISTPTKEPTPIIGSSKFEDSVTESSFGDYSCVTPLEHWFLPAGKKFRRSLAIIRNLDECPPDYAQKGRHYNVSVEEIIKLQGTGMEAKTPVQTLRKRLSTRRSTWMRQMTPTQVRRNTFVWSQKMTDRGTLYETPPPRKSIYSTPLQRSLTSASPEGMIIERRSIRSSLQQPGSPTSSEEYTIRDLILTICKQTEPCSFSDILSKESYNGGFKLGEGLYGEVFSIHRGEEDTVLKIMPIEGEKLVNGEKQKKYQEVLSELVIAKVLDELKYEGDIECNVTSGFTELIATSLVQGCYPEALLRFWEDFDDKNGSDNDSPKMFDKDQLFIVMEQSNGGKDLESYTFSSAKQSLSIFKQIAFTLAVAETSVEFEHRDLHWGNILVSKTPKKHIPYLLNGSRYSVSSNGVKCTIIDFTLSRIKYIDQIPIYNDIGRDPEFFIATGDYQFDVYRLMKSDVEDDWSRFVPKTNARWLHYLLDKILTKVKYQRKTTKVHKDCLKVLEGIGAWIEDCPSAVSVALRLAEARN